MSFLNLEGKSILVMGAANKKSVATHVAQILIEEKAKVIFSVQTEKQSQDIRKIFPDCPVYICDVGSSTDLQQLKQNISAEQSTQLSMLPMLPMLPLHGIVHSVAYAPFPNPPVPFHQIPIQNFLEGAHISCFSLVEIAHQLQDCLSDDASVVTLSISNTKVSSYGLLGPIKAALDALVGYLAKSFSATSKVRFNAVCAGPLKTSASAGIPGYMENYLFAEQLTLRRQALQTREVAAAVVFLLGKCSSGINGTQVVVDAGINCNTFDEKVVHAATKNLF